MNILYKEGSDRKSVTLSEETIKDIALDELIGYMSSYQEERDILRKIMTVIPSDPSDMLFRQEILRDLLDDEALCGSLSEVLDLIKTLGYYGGARKTITEKDITLYSLLEVMRELSVYVNATEKLEEILKNSNISRKFTSYSYILSNNSNSNLSDTVIFFRDNTIMMY